MATDHNNDYVDYNELNDGEFEVETTSRRSSFIQELEDGTNATCGAVVKNKPMMGTILAGVFLTMAVMSVVSLTAHTVEETERLRHLDFGTGGTNPALEAKDLKRHADIQTVASKLSILHATNGTVYANETALRRGLRRDATAQCLGGVLGINQCFDVQVKQEKKLHICTKTFAVFSLYCIPFTVFFAVIFTVFLCCISSCYFPFFHFFWPSFTLFVCSLSLQQMYRAWNPAWVCTKRS